MPTCVGLRYGRPHSSPQGFSRVSTPEHSRLGQAPATRHPVSACAYAVRRPIHTAAAPSFHGPPALQHCGTGREYSPAGHRLRLWGLALGPASPGADCHGAGTLGLPVCGVLTRICAYSFRHPHFPPLHPQVSTGASPLRERSPTPQSTTEGRASAGRLIPTILGARTLDR